MEFSSNADGTRRAARIGVDIAIDVDFQKNDAFRATVLATPPPPPAPAAPPARRTVWWPLVLMGFVVVVCATIAFLKSPLAKHPSVAPYANALVAKIG